MAENDEQTERNQQVMRYRILAGEVTDPLAASLLRQIVSELEADLVSKGDMSMPAEEHQPT